MLQINPPIESIIKSLGKQIVKKQKYRPFTYILEQVIEDGILLYNFMTREFVLLSHEEYVSLNILNPDNALYNDLIEKWFYVPEDNDDYKTFIQSESIARIIHDNGNRGPMKTFIIYSTTDCNARCFYCFELKCNRINMTEKTANDVADYIINKSEGNDVNLLWFGGEPLYNMKPIDIITQKLVDNNIAFTSKMTSNAYLFDDSVVEKATKLWNLKSVQITLDGTETVYNRCKAYIYKDEISPFLKVISNIERILKANIFVQIRLNIDIHNCDDLSDLTKYLLKNFEKYDNYHIYMAPLIDKTPIYEKHRSLEEKTKLWNKIAELESLLKENNKSLESGVEYLRTTKHCMADNNCATTILPNGNLGKCEHYLDSDFYGSIYSEEVDNFYINKFKEVKDFGEKCHTCPLQPKCLPLKYCGCNPIDCDEFDKKIKIEEFKRQMTVSYNYYKSNNSFKEISDNELV